MQTVEVRWDDDATTSRLIINSLCLDCNTSLDIVDADDDPNLI